MASSRLLLGLGAAGAAWWFWPELSSAASAAGIPLPSMSTAPSGTAARDYIIAAFVSSGLSLNLGRAAAVNAYAESRWNPSILSGFRSPSGVRENSVGWFQLNANGLGKPYALPLVGQPPNEEVAPGDPRLRPEVQCEAVIAACKRSSTIMTMQTGGTVRALTAAFCTIVEQPANASIVAAERVRLVSTLFPGVD